MTFLGEEGRKVTARESAFSCLVWNWNCPYDQGHGSVNFFRVSDAKLCTFDVPNPGWRHLFEEIPLRTFFVQTAAEHSRELILTDNEFQKVAKKWSEIAHIEPVGQAKNHRKQPVCLVTNPAKLMHNSIGNPRCFTGNHSLLRTERGTSGRRIKRLGRPVREKCVL